MVLDSHASPALEASTSIEVTSALGTVHLPPDRAVLTTPGMVGLMEQCIAGAETREMASSGAAWYSRSVEIRHRAALRVGQQLWVHVERLELVDGSARWRVNAVDAAGRVVGEGHIVRSKDETCRS